MVVTSPLFAASVAVSPAAEVSPAAVVSPAVVAALSYAVVPELELLHPVTMIPAARATVRTAVNFLFTILLLVKHY